MSFQISLSTFMIPTYQPRSVSTNTFTQVLSIISFLTTSPWTRTRWARPFHHNPSSPTEDTRATMRRLIEEANPTEGYHDEPNEEPIRATEAPSGEEGQRPRIEPSRLMEHGNEWRDEGGDQRA